MSKTVETRLQQVVDKGLDLYFRRVQRGIEKESLRVDPDGVLAQTPHPASIGAALTHPYITTDYSEAQLEFITPVRREIDELTDFLTAAHHFVYQNIGDEKLWVNSMPCILHGDARMPIARYGFSNAGKLKEVYRRGLGHRYGRLMQTISGIHFNFSLPESFWREYLDANGTGDLQNQISGLYFALIRNFHRYSWLYFYLFGASPAVCKTFLEGRKHTLNSLAGHSFYAPYATSLRMSGLGYGNDVQAEIPICYNDLQRFVSTIGQATSTSYPPYEKIGIERDGEFQQLNTNLLQIENEYYSDIRPKRIARRNERPSHALRERGVEYVEIRCVDLDPFVPIGIGQECIRFLDLLLIFCLLDASPEIAPAEQKKITENRKRVVLEGRKPGLTLCGENGETPFREWAADLLHSMRPIAERLDTLEYASCYRDALQRQLDKLEDTSLTPSARILEEMKHYDSIFFEFSMAKAEQHEKFFKHLRLEEETKALFSSLTEKSIASQRKMEASDSVDFRTYLKEYYNQ
ncbi:MAG: glutamate--cysteine ligase [Pseudomonadota bacterium]|nr:glutamate--cysteine ligase [Pseudomonadota bacterium]